MRVSVVMSAYNEENHIKEAIESVLNQSFNDFEFIIIDDCSVDNTSGIINNFNDKRIKLIKNEVNSGLAFSLNRGIEAASGEYIARFDADDICDIDRLKRQVDFLDTNTHVDVVGSFLTLINSNGDVQGIRSLPVYSNDIKKSILRINPLCHPSVMIRKGFFDKVGLYNVNYKNAPEDYDLWLRGVKEGVDFFNIPEPLLKYRSDGFSCKRNFKFRLNEFKIRLKNYYLLKVKVYNYFFALVPLILAFVPEWVYRFIKNTQVTLGNED